MRTVIVGGGAAGLWCALHAAERGPVVVVAPSAAAESATRWAQGGIAAALGGGDSPEAHAADTIAAGAGLCDPAAVDVLVHEAPAAIVALRRIGMVFDDERPAREGGHSAARVLHAGGDASGQHLLQSLAAAAAKEPRISRVDARATAVSIADDRARGVELDDGSVESGDRVVLATGGACGIFGRRTGPDQSIGRGLELAWRAGATLADLEFVQFHPTALDMPGQPARLFTEALRGEGAILVDSDGKRFMDSFDPRGELAARDVVARAVLAVRERTGRPVYLDCSPISDVDVRFPVAAASCRGLGLDLARDPIPVAPAAHYFTGGVLTDTWGRTTVPRLLACGEAACTGVHGANRLASNSLAEALVFGRRAALADDRPMEGPSPAPRASLDSDPPAAGLPLEEVRAVADRWLGPTREAGGLAEAGDAFHAASEHDGSETATMVAWLLAAAALRRAESRGGHFRSDHPSTDQAWAVHQTVSKSGWGTLPVRV